MEAVLVFFRDVLDGPIYVVVFIVCLILIFVCISGIKKNIREVKEKKEKAMASKIILLDPTNGSKRVEIDINNTSCGIGREESVPQSNLNNAFNSLTLTAMDAVLPNNITQVNEMVSTPLEEVPMGNNSPKKVVMIDPKDVALASSTVNVIGPTGSHQNMNVNLDNGNEALNMNGSNNVSSASVSTKEE